ncbi:DUF4179 domain-containing protein [Paenibacillus macquariensis]|uniref:DUF4179 domain-containing protein n=1 Tax=Paenibacillus macquariensis TaxID=948756 RepID=A0ABY1JQ18_9BACL|nr:DUF4179 domain-containing protein [Paenibacillus macquariensis]MEC0094072.1 DUF4179 domain-containing protein [Paenibacillus macquariensis]OAB37532.1 hypothetical protein PMSM_05605 [Paenibacillus macquariensis subsp. macquariensis]SIQ55738.1 protein of unknown function [Paenibacillus macquariensis]
MIEREERILHQDADEVNKRVETLQEMKIYNAMRGGIMRGKKREKKHIYSLGIGAVVTVAAAVLITFSFFKEVPVTALAQDAVRSSITKNWSDSEIFRSSSVQDKSFVSALERNLIKPVYQSVEIGGLKVEVMGAVTDGRKVFVLHSVQNNTDQTVVPADFSLDYGDFKAPSIGGSLDITSEDNQIRPGQIKYFVYSNNSLSPSVSYPKDVKFNMALTETSDKALASSGSRNSKYRTDLDVPFELDPDMFKDKTHTLKVERILTIDGQKINVHQVLYTPLSTYVDLEYDKDNEKQIFELINPVLIATKGGKSEKLYYPNLITSFNSEVYTDTSKATLVYKNFDYSQPDSITLKTLGISAVDKDQMKIVVDLNQKQIISAPGSDLELVEPEPENYAEEGEILLRQKIENETAQMSITYPWFSNTFTDAQGQVHNNVRVNKTTSGGNFGGQSSKDNTVVNELRYRFGENAKDYPQPLTITIARYANPIMDTQSLELYSKD